MSETRKLAQTFADHLSALRLMDVFAMLAVDGTYTIIGTTRVSRTYKGRQDLMTKVPPLMAGFKTFPTITMQPPIVDGDRAVLLGQARKGEGPYGPYDQPHLAFSLRASNGEITEVVEYVDTCMLETSVFGKKLIDA